MRRAIDIAVSVAALTVLSPLLLALVLAIRLDSRGPSVFKQVRVGRGGEPFVMYKFRTMRINVAGLRVTSDRDPRITALGRWLRSTKLDELPQLFNVVRGDMSLVGPRPEVPIYVDEWPWDARTEVLQVRPGITDPAAVHFRRESEILADQSDPDCYYREVLLPMKVSMYLDYVRTRTLMGDLRLLLRTAKSVIVE